MCYKRVDYPARVFQFVTISLLGKFTRFWIFFGND